MRARLGFVVSCSGGDRLVCARTSRLVCVRTREEISFGAEGDLTAIITSATRSALSLPFFGLSRQCCTSSSRVCTPSFDTARDIRTHTVEAHLMPRCEIGSDQPRGADWLRLASPAPSLVPQASPTPPLRRHPDPSHACAPMLTCEKGVLRLCWSPVPMGRTCRRATLRTGPPSRAVLVEHAGR